MEYLHHFCRRCGTLQFKVVAVAPDGKERVRPDQSPRTPEDRTPTPSNILPDVLRVVHDINDLTENVFGERSIEDRLLKTLRHTVDKFGPSSGQTDANSLHHADLHSSSSKLPGITRHLGHRVGVIINSKRKSGPAKKRRKRVPLSKRASWTTRTTMLTELSHAEPLVLHVPFKPRRTLVSPTTSGPSWSHQSATFSCDFQVSAWTGSS